MNDNIVDLENLNDDELLSLLDNYDYDDTDDTDTDESLTEDINNEYNICPVCDMKDTIVEDSTQGIFVCNNCGSIIGNLMDKNPEWKQFNEDGTASTNSSRCSVPMNHFLPQSSLGTSISGYGRTKVKTLHGWYAMPYKERSLNNVLKEIQFACRKNHILKYIEDDAKILYKNISECKHKEGKNKGKNIIIRGSNRRSLIFACIFFACRRKGCTRSLKEISDMGNLKMTELTKGCKLFLKLIKQIGMEYDLSSSTAEHFITRYCHALHFKKEYINKTIQIASNIKKLNIASVHTPLSVATGSILLTATIYGLPITKKTIAQQFSVSEVTVSKAYKKLEPYRDILLNDELVNNIVELMEKEKKDSQVPDMLENKMDLINNKSNSSSDNSSDKSLDKSSNEYKNIKFTIDDSVDEYVNKLEKMIKDSKSK
jgi:transcription initiation factor TFIIIB Brf1 subunit/transcription initiation factor TFIIB